MISIHALSKAFGSRTVLQTPALELERGRIYAIIGANGSGKSTFARLLAGTLSAGISPFAVPVTCGYLPQTPYAFRQSVLSNLLLSCKDVDRAEQLLAALHLEPLAEQRADRLSGGERARMALARLLMRDYELLICDEPTAAMDVETTLQSEALLDRYRTRTGCTILLITHNLQQARRLADEVLFLHRGKLEERGKTAQVLDSPQSDQTRQFLDCYGR